MSGRKQINVIYHWGGQIVEDSVLGVLYEGGRHNILKVRTGTKYNPLVRKLHEKTGIDSSEYKLVLSCRFPTFISNVPTNCIFMRLSVDDDDTVDCMLNVIAENSHLSAMHLYIETMSILQQTGRTSRPPISNYPPLQQNLSQQHDYNQQPSSSEYHNTVEYDGGASSQYQNAPQYHNPSQPSFSSNPTNYDIGASSQFQNPSQNQSHLEAIPQSPIVAVVELLQQSGGNEESDREDGQTDGSDDEEMEQVDREIEALRGAAAEVEDEDGGGGDARCDSPQRLYTPMEYYTTPQPCVFGVNYDWQTPPDYRTRCMFDPKKDQLKKGLLFRSKDDLQNAVRLFNITAKREFTVKKSTKGLWEVICMHAASTRCVWRVRASIQKRHGMWEIVRYEGDHTCIYEQLSTGHAQISSKMIARMVAGLVKNDPGYKISNIIVEVLEKFEFTVSYYKAWSAKQKAVALIFGDWESSYRILPKFLGAIIKYNPGSVMRYQTLTRSQVIGPLPVGVDVLDRIFFAFKPCIEGWKSCRPMICIDATHLYGKYKGKIFVAVGKDANRQIYPLAFAYVDEESKSTWGWFLKHLRIEVVGQRRDICLISDRHKGIIAAINDHQNGWGPQYRTHHRYCIRHVRSNLLKEFPDETLKDLFWRAATEFQPRKFDAVMEEIKTQNADAWAYCMKIPVKMWTLCHDGGYRYGETTSNCAEVFNNVLKAARSLPITAAVQVIYYKMVQGFEEKRELAASAIPEGGLTITPGMLEIFDRYQSRAGRHRVVMFNRSTGKAEINSYTGSRYGVSLYEGKCSCGKWEINHVPCSHAMAVCKSVKLNASRFFSEYFQVEAWRNSYAPQFEPLLHEDYWEDPVDMDWIPNFRLKRTKGRPQENRFFNEMDVQYSAATKHCGLCRAPGHTRAKCPQRPTASLTRQL